MEEGKLKSAIFFGEIGGTRFEKFVMNLKFV